MAHTFDVVVVGGGIAGGALALALARGGLGVLVLERQVTYRDRILGEGMMPWGVAEARRNGVEDAIIGNPEGTVTLTHWLEYGSGRDPESVEADALAYPFREAVPDVEGILCVRHPIACAAFIAAAERGGAVVVRGAAGIRTVLGPRPIVSWTVDDQPDEASCRLVVGADGKVSTMRRTARMELREDAPTSVAAGMLTGGLDGAPATMGYSLTESDRRLISFPQAGARARLYVCVSIAERKRFSGAAGVERFLAAWASPSLPFGDVIAGGRSEGPCGTFPLNSAYVDTPVGDGVVLIGDAAGWVDPLIGQGLSMAMRDARSIAEVLLDGQRWDPASFAGYVTERRHRLTVLALNARVQQRLDVDFSDEFVPRRVEVGDTLHSDEMFGPLLGTQLRGPESADPAVLGAPELARLSGILGIPM